MRLFVLAPLALLAAPAHAASGYAACSAISPTQSKLFLAAPVAADNAGTTALVERFATMLRDKGYAAKSMYAGPNDPPPPLNIDCRWFADRQQAADWSAKLRGGAPSQNLQTMSVSFDG